MTQAQTRRFDEQAIIAACRHLQDRLDEARRAEDALPDDARHQLAYKRGEINALQDALHELAHLWPAGVWPAELDGHARELARARGDVTGPFAGI